MARGEHLTIQQDEITANGHAIELRVYAEDSKNNFLPSVGTLSTYLPPVGKGIRVDDGFRQGMTVPIYYDPMLSKLITHADTRIECIKLLAQAIEDFKIKGIESTLDLGAFVMEHKAFISGNS